MNVYEVKLIRLQVLQGDEPERIESCHYVASDILKVWDVLQPELHDEGVEVLSITARAPILAVLG